MNYTDSSFLLFFAATFGVYYLAPTAVLQGAVLIVASLIFYAWEAPELLAILLISWLITGISSHRLLTARAIEARVTATVGVVANLGLLCFFKYKLLFTGISVAGDVSSDINPIGRWLLLAPLPIGISFYTFHGISLLVDVFRGKNLATFDANRGLLRHLADTLLYLVFFPQLIAGPIIKAKEFFPQVGRKRIGDIPIGQAARILILGFFLKAVVADNLSEQTFWINFPGFKTRSSLDLMVLLYGYSAQIFADFAGYSLIAIGLALLLGYRLPANFNFPYLSSSISEFWRRWHISLSSWLRDYLYIPLGGNRCSSPRTYFNLILVMLLGGLWHGAAWSFALWGLWHGGGLAIERLFRDAAWLRSENGAIVACRRLFVFNFVTLGWLFFKLQDFNHAWGYLRCIFHNDVTGFAKVPLITILSYSSAVVLYHLWDAFRPKVDARLFNAVYGVMLFAVIVNSGPKVPFIYFQF